MNRLILKDLSTNKSKVWEIDDKLANELTGLVTGICGPAREESLKERRARQSGSAANG